MACRVDKEFGAEVEVELVILKVVMIDEIDRVDKFDRVDKYKGIVSS